MVRKTHISPRNEHRQAELKRKRKENTNSPKSQTEKQ
jgi:hypothetical protein